jgi:hypothetical protein
MSITTGAGVGATGDNVGRGSAAATDVVATITDSSAGSVVDAAGKACSNGVGSVVTVPCGAMGPRGGVLTVWVLVCPVSVAATVLCACQPIRFQCPTPKKGVVVAKVAGFGALTELVAAAPPEPFDDEESDMSNGWPTTP